MPTWNEDVLCVILENGVEINKMAMWHWLSRQDKVSHFKIPFSTSNL